MESSLITQYLGPHARRVSQYRIHTSAPAARTYEAALGVVLREVPMVRLLFGVRGVPYRTDMTVREFFSTGSFRILGEDPPREIVFAMERAEMRAVGNFRIMTTPSGSMLSTETWVETATSRADRAFRLYWVVIAPFSGLIRRVLLDAAKRWAEN